MLGVSSFNWVKLVKDADLPANAKYLALYLSTFMNSDNAMAWPSLRRIEHETGLSRPTVIKYLKVLEDTEWLLAKRSSVRITTSGGYQDVNEYLVSVPQRVVKEIAHLSQGGKTGELGWLNSEPKVVKELNRNNNINNNNNNNKTLCLPKTLNIESWNEYLEHRTATRAGKLKPKSVEKLVLWLIAQGGHEVQAQIIDQSIRNGWKGLFELKGEKHGNNQPKSASERVRENCGFNENN